MSYGSGMVGGLALPQENPSAVAMRDTIVPEKAPEEAKEVGALPEGAEPSATLPPSSLLVGYITNAWTRNNQFRTTMQYRLLRCLWARRAQYSPGEEAEFWTEGAGELLYQPLAATKMRQAEVAFRELLFPDSSTHPWGLSPMPVSELPPEIEAALKAQAMAAARAQMAQLAQTPGQTMDHDMFAAMLQQIKSDLWDQAREQHKKVSSDRAERMEDFIEQRLTEGGYYKALGEFIQHICTFPSAVLKGPYLSMHKVRTWEDNKLVVKNKPLPTWKAVHPMDCFPAPGAADCQDGDFFERIRLTRADLYDMIGLPGYYEPAIRRTLESHAIGGLANWTQGDQQRRAAEGLTGATYQATHEIDALHYWGSVQGRDLTAHGIHDKISDPLGYYEVDAILIGNELVRCEVNDDAMGERPYWKASYDLVPGAFWGNAIYDLVESSQLMVNACSRALNANLGLASGPIQTIDVAQLAAGQDPRAIRPLQQIQLDTSHMPTPRAAVQFFQAESRSADLIGVMDEYEKRADLYSGIPRYQEGHQDASGAAATLGGLSLLMSAASKGLRRAVANVDEHVIAPTISKTYDWEMLSNPDPEVKGPCRVVARGAVAILIKEHLQTTRMDFLTRVTSNPALSNLVGEERVANILRHVVSTLELPVEEIVPSSQELKQKMANVAPPEPDVDAVLKSKTELERAKITTESQERIAAAKLGSDYALQLTQHAADEKNATKEQ